MKIAITGGHGQLGHELHRVLGRQVIALARPDFDITKAGIVQKIANLKPDLAIHTAAMTDVDACARDPVTAFRVNALGTQNVALACQRVHAAMLYISTNEVFDGKKDSPYLESDLPNPINPYGASKLAGERYVQTLLDRFYIVRTAWLFAPGENNFPKKIIGAAKRQEQLAVVDDEIGNPTYAPDLANAVAQLIETNNYGIYHFINEGVVSRYDWAVKILELAGINIQITRTKLDAFKRDSHPPPYSALENRNGTGLGIRLRNWQDALKDYFNA